VRKEDIEPPEPGSLPPRISFIEQEGGSAGYYVRFKDISEGDLNEGGDSEEKDAPKEEGDPKKGSDLEEEGDPIRRYVPILQFDSQEEALQAAISFRNRTAEKLGLPIRPSRGPHEEETREKISESHNRVGLRGLGVTLSSSDGTIYPILRALWSKDGDQETVTRAMTQRGICATVEALAPYLREHVHPSLSEEEIIRREAEGTARRLLQITEDASPESQKRNRIESLLERWAKENPKDRTLLEELMGT